ncbi:MAG: hypothetical protein ACLPWF_20780 [Bryobacteraceae bacterium]
MTATSGVLLSLLLAAPTVAYAEPDLSADAIMARVAANQDRAEAERSHYVYVQQARVVSRKGETVLCEQVTDFRVTPSATGSDQQLLKVDGRVRRKHRYVTYTALPTVHKVADGELDIEIGDDDRNLVESLRTSFTDAKSRDGINSGLFPLTSKNQAQYRFQLIGRERTKGRDVFHIEFRPKAKDDFGWKGDAYIDAAVFEPVVVSTGMARKVPFAVRTLLGTNLPGLGFTVTYAPLQDGVWVPASFGTEFKIHVLFFYARDITINVENRDFVKTHVESNIVGIAEPPQ